MVLFSGQLATAKSPWFLIGRYLSPTITIEHLEAGGSVSIRVTNRPELGANGAVNTPDVNYDGVPHPTLGSVTVNSANNLGGAYTWIRAIKTSATPPTPPDPETREATDVYFQAQVPR